MGEAEKYGIKELEEVMLFGLGAGKVAVGALEDGFQPGDLFAFLPLVKTGAEAFEGIQKVPSELGDMSDAEVDHLVAKVQSLVSGISPEKARKLAIKGVQLGLVAVQFVNEMRA